MWVVGGEGGKAGVGGGRGVREGGRGGQRSGGALAVEAAKDGVRAVEAEVIDALHLALPVVARDDHRVVADPLEVEEGEKQQRPLPGGAVGEALDHQRVSEADGRRGAALVVLGRGAIGLRRCTTRFGLVVLVVPRDPKRSTRRAGALAPQNPQPRGRGDHRVERIEKDGLWRLETPDVRTCRVDEAAPEGGVGGFLRALLRWSVGPAEPVHPSVPPEFRADELLFLRNWVDPERFL